MPKVLLYGSLNVDYVYKVPHILKPKETLSSSSRAVYAGGKGLNQAIALSRAGSDVYFLGAVGLDDGQILLDTLKNSTINLDFLKIREHESSGHTFIQVDSEGQNCIMLYGGTNRTNQLDELDAAIENFESGDYLVLQNETNDIAYIMEKAAAKQMHVCINVAPIDDNVFNLPLHLCEYIIVNEIEGAALVREHVSDDGKKILEKLKAKYPSSNILLTLGSQGAMLGFKKSLNADDISCEAFNVDVVDTTAAGDTFLGYFIDAISKGQAPLNALKKATAASALAVMKAGATPSIPNKEDVLNFLNTKLES